VTYGEVYVVTCSVNGKQYVGQTTSGAEKRWYKHQRDACTGRGRLLAMAIRKYGVENFRMEVADTATSLEDLNVKEIALIAGLNSRSPHGYNLMEGGSNGKHSEETLAKMRGRVRSPEARAKMRLAKLGTQPSPQAREAARLVNQTRQKTPQEIGGTRKSNQERVWTSEMREKASLAQRGHKRSPESVEKTRRAHLGKKLSPEHIEKTRQANLGRKPTAETRSKMSEAARRRGGGSPEALEAMRQASLGRVWSPEARAKLSDRLKGLKRSPEAIERMRAAKAVTSPETLERMQIAAQKRARRQRELRMSLGGIK
jgi:group I intron endonuclease